MTLELNNVKNDVLDSASHCHPVELRQIKKGASFTNVKPVPLSSGDSIPVGTAFVCERGGKTTKMVYWHSARERYERLRMPKQDCTAYFISVSTKHLPVTLALHFDISLSEHDVPDLEVGGAYLVLGNIRLANNTMLLSGDVVVCNKASDGLGVFYVHGSLDQGSTFLLPPPDQVMLRYIADCRHLAGHSASREGATWVH